MVTENLACVKERMRRACERSARAADAVKLVIVTKEATLEQIREVIEAGATDLGENRVKDAILKKTELNSHVLTWHMIGHLQSNKAKAAVKHFSVIHSVDSIKLTYSIDVEAKKINKVQDIMIEVNTSGEESKFGTRPEVLAGFLREAKPLRNVNIAGLMTMAPFVDDPEKTRPFFKKLKELADEHDLKELSMGMTQDFEVAIEEGATMVRIGGAIFKNTNS